MISVRVAVDRRGRLRGVHADGHAGLGRPGTDPACAAVTAILRTVARLAAQDGRFRVSGNAAAPGELQFSIRPALPLQFRRLRALADFVVQGVGDVERDYPGAVQLETRRGGEGEISETRGE